MSGFSSVLEDTLLDQTEHQKLKKTASINSSNVILNSYHYTQFVYNVD